MSISDFGMLTFSFALAQLFSVCFEYGLTPYIAKEIAAMKTGRFRFERVGYGLHLFLMLVGLIVFLAVLPLFELSPVAESIAGWIGASVFITSTMRFFFAYYQGREKIHLEFLGSFSEIVILLAVVGAAVFQQADVLTIAKYFFFARALAWIAAYVLLGVSEYWLVPKFDRLIWGRMISESMPFAFTFFIAFAITSIDTILLQQLAPTNASYEVGLYQAALRIVLIPTILAMVVTKVLLPQLSRMGHEQPTVVTPTLRHLNDFLHTIGLLAGVFVFYHAESLVILAYGDRYFEAAKVVQILGATLVLRFGAAYNLYFALRNKMWLRVLFALLALCAAVLLNIILIPKYGVIGVAFASVITHIIYWLPFLFAMKRFEDTFLLGWKVGRAVVAATLFLVGLYITRSLPFVINLIWSGVFVVAVSILFADGSLRDRVLRTVLNRA